MHPIYTFGYSGSTPAGLRDTVHELGALLVDIRYSPRSRVPQWNGAALQKLLGGQSYMHLRELGNANYKNAGPIQLVDPAQAVAILRPVLEKRAIILMCGCKDAATCHRTPAANYLVEQLGAEVVHIEDRMDDVKRIAMLKPKQLSLF